MKSNYIKFTYLFILVFSFVQCNSQKDNQQELQSHKKILKLMGTRFEISATSSDQSAAVDAVNKGVAEIERIENIISSWLPDSQTSAINANAGIQAVVVDEELFELIKRSKKISQLTNGAFDISFASMERLYKFDRQDHELPSDSIRENAISKINYQDIILDEEKKSVFLKEKGMRIGFGGIGKGYAANKAKALMKDLPNIQGGVVNASGDLIVWGKSKSTDGWPVQISDPKNPNKSIGWLSIKEASVVTSGDYEKYFTNNGRRYAHIIDPKTGLPTTGIKSVTVISPDTEIGDALATSVFVLGEEKGMELINQLKNIEAVIITDDDRILKSKNIELNEN